MRNALAAAAIALAAVALALATCGDRERPRRDQADAPPPSDAESPEESTAMESRPLSPDMREIAQMIAAGRLDMARLRLQRTLSRNPDDAHAQFLYGLTFQREMRYEQARMHFERAIELMPGYHQTYHFYGYTLYYLGEHDAARRAFQTHLSFVPTEGDTHFGLGLIELDADDLDAAERRFLRAIELEMHASRADGVAKSRARLGETFERQGRLEEARLELEAATQMNRDLYEAWYMLYRVLMRLGDEEAAERALAEHEAARQRVRPDPAARQPPPGP